MALAFLLLAFLLPIVLPAAAFGFGTRLGFWMRIVGTLLASVVSLPLGFLLTLFAYDPALLTHDHINPGLGVTAIPLVYEWAVVFATTLVIALYLSVQRVFFRPKR